jgi:enoyl-CoA hydratase
MTDHTSSAPSAQGSADIAPMGPTRLALSKPVIAAVEGYAVGGGLELAVWCDLRVAGDDARFGVSSRRFGVPLVDGGTVRLPQLIGLSRALELILTGEIIGAEYARHIGLVNRLVRTGAAETEAVALAQQVASFPQLCMRADRRNARESCGVDSEAALNHEFGVGYQAIQAGETLVGATRFSGGAGRHGALEHGGHGA